MSSARVTLVESRDQLAGVVDRAQQEPIVAVDTEAASFHRYTDRIFLIQLSTAHSTAIIDPLAVDDLSALETLLANPAIETVIHDADYDLRMLDRSYGFRVRGLFDTRIAAQLLGEPAVGLAALLEKYLGVKLSKKWQRADWSRRPLPAQMIAYAASDTKHLIELRAHLQRRLLAGNRLHWAEEEFAHTEQVRWTGQHSGRDGYLRIKGAKQLTPRERAVLRVLYEWREGEGKRRDLAVFRIVSNDALIALARRRPGTPRQLRNVPELPTSTAARYGAALLIAISQGEARPEEMLPVGPNPRPSERSQAYIARLERLAAARNGAARALRLDPGVLCGKTILNAVARAAPRSIEALRQIVGMRKWQVEVLGDALLEAIAS